LACIPGGDELPLPRARLRLQFPGIGRQTALSFAKYGIQRLALADMNTKTLTDSIKDIKKLYPHVDVLPLQMNVRKTPEVKSGIAETVKKFGRLDIAVNNAGIGPRGLTHELDEEIYESVIDVDLNGVWRCEKEELNVMLKQEDLGFRLGRGNIINVASMYGTRAQRNTMPNTQYTTAKHGKSLAREHELSWRKLTLAKV
jgi:NAD(P)-dependent dehydrogenase (short-subunit alcohol dehydrogenase family)